MKIHSPNKNYTGVSASVAFCNGIGETQDPRLIKWFCDHGYTIKEGEEASKKPNRKQLKKDGE